MINAVEWFKEKGFTFDDKITIADVIQLQNDSWDAGASSVFPPLPVIMGKQITREDVIDGLRELLDGAIQNERVKDPTFRRWPDVETILEYIAEHGLEPKAKTPSVQ